MPAQIAAGPVHHLRLTVTDIERSRQFYTSLLGFQVAVESPPPGDPSEAEAFRILFGGVVMVRGDLLMGLRPMAPGGDRFDPDRVGLTRPPRTRGMIPRPSGRAALKDEQGLRWRKTDGQGRRGRSLARLSPRSRARAP